MHLLTERGEIWEYTNDDVKVKPGDEIIYQLNVVIDDKHVTTHHKDIREYTRKI